jgi:hypothetical protein
MLSIKGRIGEREKICSILDSPTQMAEVGKIVTNLKTNGIGLIK